MSKSIRRCCNIVRRRPPAGKGLMPPVHKKPTARWTTKEVAAPRPLISLMQSRCTAATAAKRATDSPPVGSGNPYSFTCRISNEKHPTVAQNLVRWKTKCKVNMRALLLLRLSGMRTRQWQFFAHERKGVTTRCNELRVGHISYLHMLCTTPHRQSCLKGEVPCLSARYANQCVTKEVDCTDQILNVYTAAVAK